MMFSVLVIAIVLCLQTIWGSNAVDQVQDVSVTHTLRDSLIQVHAETHSSTEGSYTLKDILQPSALRGGVQVNADLNLESIEMGVSLSAYAGTGSYSKSLASHYAYFTAAAYCADPEFFLAGNGKLTKWTCKYCQAAVPNLPANSNNIQYFQAVMNGLFAPGSLTDINGIIVYDNIRNEIVISFAGTNPTRLANIIVDLAFSQVTPDLYPRCTGGCLVHGGFYNSYKAVRSNVIAKLKAFLGYHPGAKIAVTGHSLGAALAAHCAADLVVQGYTVQPLYTYGMPRVGNQAFATWYYNTLPGTYRVINNWDPVPHLGFRNTFGQLFSHFPYEIWYTGFAGFPADFNKAPKLCNSSGEDSSCSNQYELLIYANLVGELVSCHTQYLDVNYYTAFADCAL